MTPEWVQNSIAINLSRDTALMFGLVEPTDAERAEAAERSRVYEERQVQAWRLYDYARATLAAITDPLARKILDLHSADNIEAPKCQGCDMDGYECGAPEWPCRTVRVVAQHHGVPLPDATYLWRRP